jgi:hypothetical protein
MIAEYRLYHGAVLLEIVTRHAGGISICGSVDDGRPASYLLNGNIVIHVKHSTSRLRPWQFAFTRDSMDALSEMNRTVNASFVVLVCGTDGMLCLSFEEMSALFISDDTTQPWLRVDRRKGHHYAVYGPTGELSTKKAGGLDPILRELARQGEER